MGFETITPGPDAPHTLNAVIETAPHTGSVKYELDKDSGLLMVDRYMTTTMRYPCLYGFVPNTLAEDGDPLDVLVLSPDDVIPGSLIVVRPIGVLVMEDEAGLDSKILTAPTEKCCPALASIQTLADVSQVTQDAIKHFFEHYKDLEANKWVKVTGWEDQDRAKAIISAAIDRVAK